ncbi:hypothetical protein [Streptomyces sp. NPDC051561]|uniref:hypothetical protein n=1 Tax=Streptomyces sp. NPDC051561 TaxID=3365658 RepID=UPI00379E3C22
MSAPTGRAAAPPAGTVTDLRSRRTLLAAAGAGTLLVPAALEGRAGAPFTASAVAAFLLAWYVLVARAGGTRGRGVAGLVAEAWGPVAGRAVHACYFTGIACGQAAVAGAAGEFAADGTAATLVAAAVLAVATGCAVSGVLPGPRGRRLRLVSVLALTAGWWLLPGLLSLDGRLPGGGEWGVGATALVVLFAWVGMEGDVPPPPHGRVRARARLLYGPVLAAVLLTLLLSAPRPGPDAASAPGVAGVCAALVLTAYCVTNLAACGGRWPLLLGSGGPPGGAHGSATGVWVAAGTAVAVLFLAKSAQLPAAALFLLPGAATAAILVLAAAAALRRRGRWSRAAR